MFKVNNNHTETMSFDVILVSMLLTLNIFSATFCPLICFYLPL